jgi:KipI family sensor histidine kinase inhibitor
MQFGFYIPFADKPDVAASSRALNAVQAMREQLLEGVTDIIPSYLNIYFEFDARVTDKKAVQNWALSFLNRRGEATQPEARIARKVLSYEQEGASFAFAVKTARLALPESPVEIPVAYNGLDLEFISEKTGLTIPEIIQLHSSHVYHAFAVGFTPGFPFLGVLPPALHLPRRTVPRAKVEAHSVGIAMAQTGVYPFSSPGGWHVLGSAGVAMFDPHRNPPFWVQAGDAVRFVPVNQVQVPIFEPVSLLPSEPRFPVLQLEQAGLQTLLLDSGRSLMGHFGLAQSGVLDARSAARANAVVGNAPDAPLLELTLLGGVFTALSDVVLGFAGFGMIPVVDAELIPVASSFLLRRGQSLSFQPSNTGVRGYLSVAGGFEGVPMWKSVSSDARAGLGRALQAGDVLGARVLKSVRAGFSLSQPSLESRVFRLLKGQQFNPEAFTALTKAVFRVERGDRMGLRLSGAVVAGGDVSSEATPLGAVQVTSGGQPIVLLHDRGRMGGYAKPAVVHPSDLWRLAQLRDGQSLRFSRLLY